MIKLYGKHKCEFKYNILKNFDLYIFLLIMIFSFIEKNYNWSWFTFSDDKDMFEYFNNGKEDDGVDPFSTHFCLLLCLIWNFTLIERFTLDHDR